MLRQFGQGEYELSAWVKTLSATTQAAIEIRIKDDEGIRYPQVTGDANPSEFSELKGAENITWTGAAALRQHRDSQ